jgi:TldD protein
MGFNMLRDIISPYKEKIGGHTELRVQRNIERTVGLVSGNITQNASSEIIGLSARVYDGGYWGFASSVEFDGDKVEEVIGAARRNAAFLSSKLGTKNPPLPVLASGRRNTKAAENDYRQKTLLDFARALGDYVGRKYPGLTARRLGAGGDAIEKYIVSSDGADGYALVPRARVFCEMSAKADDGAIIEYGDNLGEGAGFFTDLFDKPDALYNKIDAIYEILMRKREGVYAEAGTREVVFDSKLAGILAHEAIGHTTEADLVIGGSVASSYLGKQAASEMVSMVDFAHSALGEDAPQPIFVDDEGTIARDVVLIEDGVLKAYMHNRETARRFGHEPAGNARAFLYSDEPLIRMRNTAILPGVDKLEDMIASIDDGYYLTQTGNGQADLTSEFMFSVNMGYEIKKGKLGRAIRDTTISGVAFDLLRTVTMLSDEMTWTSSGYCGKKQRMPVGMGGPAVKCRVNMGGR